jgi:hypothetical protein
MFGKGGVVGQRDHVEGERLRPLAISVGHVDTVQAHGFSVGDWGGFCFADLSISPNPGTCESAPQAQHSKNAFGLRETEKAANCYPESYPKE